MTAAYSPAVHRYALFTAACTVFLLVAGALVTSNDAGLAVPDWPTSYGSFFPPMVGGIFYEHGHRMVATFVGLVTIGLAVLLWRKESRPWMRTLGWLGLGAVILQGFFGGLTVILRLPPAVSIIHASLAQAFFCSTVSIAVFTSRWWFAESVVVDDSGSPRLLPLAHGLLGVTFLQLVLGAAFRHNAFGIWPHLGGAAAVLALVIIVSRATRRRFAAVRPLRAVAKWLNAVVGVQILLGGAAWWSRIATREAPQPQPIAIWLTVAHTVLGAIVLASTVVFVLVSHRLLSASEPALAANTQPVSS
ncbi:MAG TPA: COX15/CtaA family protein [Candidatus Acidoferrales bacterium]|nr:COX15/CtaA family protein [Candidatus Acidoferrales bacterium]